MDLNAQARSSNPASRPRPGTRREVRLLDLDEVEKDMHAFIDEHDLARHTLDTYASVIRTLNDWCHRAGRPCSPADAETVAAYTAVVLDLGGAGVARLHLAAIADHHRRIDAADSTQLARDVIKGWTRQADRPHKERRVGEPLRAKDIERIAAKASPSVPYTVLRNRAALLVSRAAKLELRRLVPLLPEHVESVTGGYVLHVPAARANPRAAQGARAAQPALEVLVPRWGGPTCGGGALDDLLALHPGSATIRVFSLTGAEEPTWLTGPVAIRTALITAARRADVTLPFAPHLGADLTETEVLRVLAYLHEDGLLFVRDRALLMVLHAAPLFPHEGLELKGVDLTFDDAALTLALSSAGMDSFGRSNVVTIPRAAQPEFCPVANLEQWIHLAGIGPTEYVFAHLLTGPGRSRPLDPQTARHIVRKLADRAGLDGSRFDGMSPRRGFSVTARESGASLLQIAIATRRRTLHGLRSEIGAHDVHQRNAPKNLGL